MAASLDDITKDRPTQVDALESFWLAETLKNVYFVFTDQDDVESRHHKHPTLIEIKHVWPA